MAIIPVRLDGRTDELKDMEHVDTVYLTCRDTEHGNWPGNATSPGPGCARKTRNYNRWYASAGICIRGFGSTVGHTGPGGCWSSVPFTI
ncbi:hypothetical protein PGTUg99_004303 [Puccinia graminis f. sp. tritici]|uniref:Uncharacterized protein n=1 Tax=Puccinia graminis f. sp. tritici TaxID=56615 RepID=A0A5B0S568_PUCGR|nr:hypothetical protein PGTUg99_004303 [Puccinia graminis f. sp. tritici]